ncbi:MAG TPA: hypothetical protein VMT00_01400 [Thermoanaerobaculia bacterium]|nr:hypothetical protein [Thermoanaerobaculia bacterium]
MPLRPKEPKKIAEQKPPAAARKPPTPAAPKASRRRPRYPQDSGPIAAWLAGVERPRPASFIPAPPRAQSPFTTAAPPASSDRIVLPEDLNEHLDYRTFPVRVDVEQAAGRTFLTINPHEIVLKPGEGVEWDFRYLGGADVTVHEIIVELGKPSPFGKSSFRSEKPGSARPHRLISGALAANAAGRAVEYTIRCMNVFKTELARARAQITVAA